MVALVFTRSTRRRATTTITVIAGLIVVAMTYFPIVFMVSNSLKSGRNIISGGVFALFTEFNFRNYVLAWNGISGSLLNTVIVAAASIVIGVSAAIVGSYAFAQTKFRGKSVLFMAYLSLLMIPTTLTIIPLFLMMQSFGLYDSWWALILPYAAGAQPLLVILFRGFFEQIPDEFMQSARIDGAKEYQVLLHVVAPLTRPIILTGAILMAITVWGDYIWPLVIIQDYHRYTISAGMQLYVSQLGSNISGIGSVFSALVITMLPLLLLVGFTMRYFVSGISEGGMKL